MALHLLVPGTAPSALVFWLALLLTYFIHSLGWAGFAALYARGKVLSSKQQHWVWKLALLGPLVTTAWAVLLSQAFERAFHVQAHVGRLLGASVGAEPVPVVGLASTMPVLGSSPAAKAWLWMAMIAGAAALGGLLRFAGVVWNLRCTLAGRKPVRDRRVRARLDALRARTKLGPVVLSASAVVESPLVIGASEICMPRGLLGVLPDAQLDAVLAHELAHLERRDAFWFPLAGLVQSLFWMQPTNHWLAARFRASAELACDDRAVELTSDPLSLARALTRVAECILQRQAQALLPSMAHARSMLLPRVRRLLSAGEAPPTAMDDRASRRARSKRRGQLWLAGTGALAALMANVSVQAARSGPPLGQRTTVAHPLRAAHETSPPNFVQLSPSQEQLAWLGRRARELQSELQAQLELAGAEQHPTSAGAVRAEELNQELRHVRAAAVWMEQRLVDECESRDAYDQHLGSSR